MNNSFEGRRRMPICAAGRPSACPEERGSGVEKNRRKVRLLAAALAAVLFLAASVGALCLGLRARSEAREEAGENEARLLAAFYTALEELSVPLTQLELDQSASGLDFWLEEVTEGLERLGYYLDFARPWMAPEEDEEAALGKRYHLAASCLQGGGPAESSLYIPPFLEDGELSEPERKILHVLFLDTKQILCDMAPEQEGGEYALTPAQVYARLGQMVKTMVDGLYALEGYPLI